MTDGDDGYVHAPRVLKELVEDAFPELKDVPLDVDYRNDPEAFTMTEYSQRCLTIFLGEELRKAPWAAKSGAIAEELCKISKMLVSPAVHRAEYLIQKYLIILPFFKDCPADISMKENEDLIERGLGSDYIAYTVYLENHCNYRWVPTDGHSLMSLMALNQMHHCGLKEQSMQ